ncbi:MAG: hypothetical protein QM679_00395 [Patulibacter sp.]
MRREQLEHVIRASGSIADDDEIMVVGSQALLGSYPNAPEALLRSVEVDLFPTNSAVRTHCRCSRSPPAAADRPLPAQGLPR